MITIYNRYVFYFDQNMLNAALVTIALLLLIDICLVLVIYYIIAYDDMKCRRVV